MADSTANIPDTAAVIGIIGGGALGTLLASRFLARGADVRVVTRSSGSRHLDLKRAHPAVRLGHDFGALEGTDLVFLCVKAYHTKDVARSLSSLPLERSSICSLQNGWGNLDLLDQALPSV